MNSQKKFYKKLHQIRIPLLLSYSSFLPNTTGIIRKFWNMVHVNKDLYEIFDDGPVTALRRNKHLKN